jgi:hypothetical protein
MPATLTNLNDTIIGDGEIGGSSYSLTFDNEAGGIVAFNGPAPNGGYYSTSSFNDAALTNAGLIKSTDKSGAFVGVRGVISNSGTIDNLASTMEFGSLFGRTFSVVNTGLIEATSSGTLLFDDGVVDGSGGGIILAAAGDQVRLQSTSIVGGTLKTSGTGLIVTTDSGSTLDGTASAVNVQGAFSIAAGDSLAAVGAIHNTGTVSLESGSALVIEAGGATFSGAGRIVMAADGTSRILAAGGAASLTDANTIVGAGTIGAGVTLVGAVLNANAGKPLSLNGADLVGGTLNTSGYGLIHLQSGTVDGSAASVTNAGTLTVSVAGPEMFTGVLANSGEMLLNGAASFIVGGTGLTLTGKGKVLLSAAGAARISGSTLTNAGNVIFGAGDIGGGAMSLVNAAGATIKATDATPLIVDTGANTIVNAGTIESVAGGVGEVMSAVNNGGWLYANGGGLTVEGAVSGTGKALIKSGTLTFTSAFNEIVSFIGTTGELVLAQSQAFTNFVRGFSKSGGTSLDLQDIAFGGATSASYSGTTTSGVLTVSDGTHTAHIHLQGDYTGSAFMLSSDGQGGTTVVDPAAPHSPAHALASAMAAFQAEPAPYVVGAHAWRLPATPLVHPQA